MIPRIPICLSATAGDDAAGTAIVGAWRRHRVFVVITARLARQHAFPVSEDDAVAGMRERSALLDQRQRGASFAGKLGNRYLRGGTRVLAEPERLRGERQKGEQENDEEFLHI